jgi:hypothetical protein
VFAPDLEALARRARHRRTRFAGAEAVKQVKEALPKIGNQVSKGPTKGFNVMWLVAR